MTEIRIVGDERERADAFAVRRTVFVEEQGVDEAIEYDEHDEPEATAAHFVAYDGPEPVGAARLREPEDGLGKVERVAVLAEHRGEGVGRKLMQAVEREAERRSLETLKLHAQTRVEEFYDRLGYQRRGEEFEEAGIPHVKMVKSL